METAMIVFLIVGGILAIIGFLGYFLLTLKAKKMSPYEIIASLRRDHKAPENSPALLDLLHVIWLGIAILGCLCLLVAIIIATKLG